MISQTDSNIKSASYIDGLCDVVPNKRRKEKDFIALLDCLERMPKECTPFKKKILQHLHIHAMDNHNLDLKLAGMCFAKATSLHRKTANKDEGPLGSWKAGMSAELINLETNIDHLYNLAGLTTNKIIDNSNDDEYNDISSENSNKEKSNYEAMIDERLRKISISVHNTCCLVSIKTEFDLPIPVVTILRLASKLCLLRWKDYKKRPNSILKEYIYSKTPQFIGLSLIVFNCLFAILGSRIIPFTPFVNQTVTNLLEWSRTSNLLKNNEKIYHSIRSDLFCSLSQALERLSLNLNLDPHTLVKIINSEIVENLEVIMKTPSDEPQLKDGHQVDALRCLENLFIAYSKFFDAQMENTVKGYVIEACINIYRDFDSNTASLAYRRQLLQLLQTIANQPFAASTTEIAYHVFELAEKVETDSGIKTIIARSLRVGLAHRPTIVSHNDVYNSYGRSMMSMSATKPNPAPKPTDESLVELAPEPSVESTLEQTGHVVATELVSEPMDEPMVVSTPEPAIEPTFKHTEEAESRENPTALSIAPDHNGYGKAVVEKDELAGDENEVQSYMSHFVDKLA